MGALVNSNQERFAQLVAGGQDAKSAYMQVYDCTDRTAGPAATRQKQKAHIAARIEELMRGTLVPEVLPSHETPAKKTRDRVLPPLRPEEDEEDYLARLGVSWGWLAEAYASVAERSVQIGDPKSGMLALNALRDLIARAEEPDHATMQPEPERIHIGTMLEVLDRFAGVFAPPGDGARDVTGHGVRALRVADSHDDE